MRRNIKSILFMMLVCGMFFCVTSCSKKDTSNNGTNSSLTAHTHNYALVNAKAATCTEDGNNEYYLCSKCNKIFVFLNGAYVESSVSEVKINRTGHSLVLIPAKAATKAEPGNISYYKCSICNKLFLKADGTNEINIENTIIPATGMPGDRYSVSYVINGHGTAQPSLTNVTALPQTLPILIEDGYTFNGWYTNTGLTVAAVAGATISKDTTLYAKWTASGMNGVMIDYIDSLIEDTVGGVPAWNMESFKGKWNYIDGVFLNSIVNLYYDLKDTNSVKAEGYKSFFISYINYYIDEDGTFINLKDSTASGFTSGELDTICESKILFDAYLLTSDTRYIKAIETTYSELTSLNIVEGSIYNYWHKTSYENQIWLDGMYMYAPFYARYAYATEDTSILTTIVNQYKYIRNNMYNSTTGLYYHGYDSTKSIFWANSTTGCSENYWLRSMGWYVVSLADIIEYYPVGEERTYLVNLLKEAIDGLLQYQDEDSKMFYQIINGVDSNGNPLSAFVPATYLEGLGNTAYQENGVYVDTQISNYLEASGSSMVAYAIMKATNRGYLTSTYGTIGREIFEGVYGHSFDATTNTLRDICITAGLGPSNRTYRDGTMAYYLAEPVGSNDAKGVGPFIMAYLEYTYGSTSSIPTPKYDIELVTAVASGKITATGTVIAVSTKSFLIKDDSGIANVYIASTPTVAVGDVVRVRGTLGTYCNELQFTNDTVYTVISSGTYVENTTPIIINQDNATSEFSSGDYIEMTGTLTMNGTYYNVAIDGSTKIVSLYSPIANLNLSSMDGSVITIRGYYLYINGGESQYINVLCTAVSSNS